MSDREVRYIINIGGNASQQTNELNTNVRGLNSSANDVNVTFDKLTMKLAMFNQVTESVTKISGAFQNLVGSSLDFEKSQTNIRTLMKGDVAAADELVSKLGEYATKTVYDRNTLVSAQQTMMSFGLSADFAYGKLLNIGDIALGDKEKMKSLALAFAQTTATGKLMGQDLNQMIGQGFNPLQIISQKTGIAMDELKDKMSKGQISAELVAKAFEWATEEGEMFYQGAEKVGETTAGKIEQMKGTIDNMKIALFEATGGATAWIAEIGGMITPITSLVPLLSLTGKAFSLVKARALAAVTSLSLYNGCLSVGRLQNLGFAKNVIQATVALGRFAVVGVLQALKALGLYVASLVTAKTTAVGFRAASVAAFKAFAATAITAFRAVSVAIYTIPIVGWIALAVTAVGALFAILYKKCDKFAATMRGLWAGMKSVFSGGSFAEAYDKEYEATIQERNRERNDEEGLGQQSALENAVSRDGKADGVNIDMSGLKGKSESAVTGGTRNTSITINVAKFMDNMIFEGGLKENSEEVESKFKEMLLRTLYQVQLS